MRLREFWRTARFRQTLIYGAMFVVLQFAMLGLVYVQTAGYLSRQSDRILRVEAQSLRATPAELLPARIDQRTALDPRHIELYGLFSREGVWITGNVHALPPVAVDGGPRELGASAGFPVSTQVLATRLPWGEILVVGREASQIAEFQRIIGSALLWTGLLVVLIALALGAALSIQPLQRIQSVREATERVAKGDLAARLPIAGNHDELDMLAGVVNAMMDEIERLVAEAKSVGDTVAHDLRTPLTRLRLILDRLRHAPSLNAEEAQLVDQALAEAETLLGRFRALLRISEIETPSRRAGFQRVELSAIVSQASELYRPLAEDRGLSLVSHADGEAWIHGDPDLLFEALGNLLDNAIKFTPTGGTLEVALNQDPEGPSLSVVDNGPGVPQDERASVTGRFYRSRRDHAIPGAGLGLSIVAAVLRVHGFSLVMESAEPGLRAVIECWPHALAGEF